MRAPVVVLIAACALTFGVNGQAAQRAEATSPSTSTAPFRAKLVSNAALVRRAASTFSNAAHQPAPAKLSTEQRKRNNEHTRWLTGGATRLGALQLQMDVVLAKGLKAPATELAQTNMSYLTLRETLESESRRLGELMPAARARHALAMTAIRGDK